MPSVIRLLGMIVAVGLAGLAPVAGQSRNSGKDGIVDINRDDPALASATARARATLDQFFGATFPIKAGTSAHAVKIPVSDGRRTEVFWVAGLSRLGNNRYSGSINNTPSIVGNVKEGQTITFSRSEIVDWAYVERGRMVGNFTLCVLLNSRTEPTLAQAEAQYGIDCSWRQ